MDPNKKVMATCYSGMTAGQTITALHLLAFDAWIGAGGMGAWDSAELPKVE